MNGLKEFDKQDNTKEYIEYWTKLINKNIQFLYYKNYSVGEVDISHSFSNTKLPIEIEILGYQNLIIIKLEQNLIDEFEKTEKKFLESANINMNEIEPLLKSMLNHLIRIGLMNITVSGTKVD